MAVFFQNETMAPYRHRTECTWVHGEGAGTIGSTSFGSCVGLVLYRPHGQAGAVAHFAGSMGGKDEIHRVESDVDEIMGRCRDGAHEAEAWQCWVFGGESLRNDANESSIRMLKVTRTLVRTVKDAVERVGRMRAMTVAMQLDGIEGHRGVRLDLATGKVTWEDKATTTAAATGTKAPAWL